VCSTVNVFNVCYLEELSHWIDSQHFDFVYWNMMHEAYYFSISTLPESAKRVITQRLQLAQVSPWHRKEFDQIIDFMNGGTSLDGTELVNKITELDQRRKQNLREVEPEFAELINYE
jgi:hypothetical protein